MFPSKRGFTILEILVVIGIIAILTAVVVLVINPAELSKKSRDVIRQADLKTINHALAVAEIAGPLLDFGDPNIVYISLPDDVSSTCDSHPELPSPPSGYQYNCVNETNLQKVDGSGWIPVNFSSLDTGSPLASLPIDPVNEATGGFYYTYNIGTWKLTAVFESDKYASLAEDDNGLDPQVYEAGDASSQPSLARGGEGGESASAPSVITQEATDVGSIVATLNGSADPNGADATGWFRYSSNNPGTCDDEFGARVPLSGGTSLGAGSSPVPYSEDTFSLIEDTTYFFCAIAENSIGKSFGSILSFNTTGGTYVTTLGDGTNPNNANIGPGEAATTSDAFTLQTNGDTDNITNVTVTLGAGTNAGISLVEITDDAGITVYGSVSNPSTDSFPITLSPNIVATVTQSQYKIRITPRSHANMPAPPGASYAVTATVTDWTGTDSHAGADSSSATVTIDNLSPDDATGVSGTAGDQQIALNWTNPGGDFSNVVILRKTSSIGDAPSEGSSPNVNDSVGSSIVRYVSNGSVFTDTGLTNGTTYYYKVFTKDTEGNYALGVQVGPYIPCAPGKYWIGGTGNWNNTTHWATSSAGVGGAPMPTSTDDVYFDVNSFTAGGQTMTINVAVNSKSMNWASVTNNPTWAGTSTLNIFGSLALASGMTRSYTGVITFSATTTGQTVTLAGKTLGGGVTFDGAGGGWTLQDDLNIGTNTLTLTRGSLNTNGKTITAGTFASSNSNTRSLTLGGSSVTLSTAGTAWNFATITALTFSAGTSTISLTGSAPTFSSGGLTYNNVVFNGAGIVAVAGANTFANLTRNGTAITTDKINFAANQIITGTLTLSGNSVINRLFVTSNGIGTARTLTAAAVSITNVDFQDITAAGAASPFSGTSIGNGLGNSNINFAAAVTRYWVGNGGNWSDVNHWSAASGGAGGASVPLSQDTAIFNASSFGSSTQTTTVNIPRLGIIDFTGVANNPTLAFSSTPNTIFGSSTLVTGMTISGTQALTFSPRSPISLTNAGRTFTNAVTIDAPLGTLIMQDAFLSNSSLTLTRGTLNANNQNVTALSFTSSNSNTRTITMGSGNWTLTGTGTVWDTSTATSLTLNANTSTIIINNNSSTGKTFAGGGKTFYNFQFTNAGIGTSTISGSNTFFSFTVDTQPKSVIFTAGTTQTVNGTSTANGASGSLMTFLSSTSGSKWYVNASSTSFSYVNVKDSTAGGTASPFACGATCVNSGNNTNWSF